MKNDVLIRVDGIRLEKLIQRALSDGAAIHSIKRPDVGSMTIEVSPSDAETILNLCRRYSISARILRLRGLPLFVDLLRRRWTVFIGIAVCVLLCCMFLGRLWIIDVCFVGAEASRGNRELFYAALSDLNIRPGISKPLDTELLSGKLAAGKSGYSYVSAKSQGIRLLLEAAPEIPEPNVYDLQDAGNLYANTDGIVLSADVYSGIACIQPGDIIKRGQLLIRGEEQMSKDEMRSIGALGKVMVRTWYEGTASGRLSRTCEVPTGRISTQIRLECMNYTLPLHSGETFPEFQTKLRHLPIGGVFLPLEIVFEDRYETVNKVIETDRETLSDQLCALAMADAAAQLTLYGPEEYEIARSWINYDTPGDGVLTATAVYEIYTDAAALKPASIQGG